LEVPRIPYFQDDSRPDVAYVVSSIQERRPKGELIALDRMLLNSPAFALGWNQMLRAVRKDLKLPLKHREMMMCAVAILNDARYQWDQHVPEWLSSGGNSEQVRVLGRGVEETLSSELFDDTEKALLQLTVEMTRDVKVQDETFERLKVLFPDEQVVEAVGVIAAYNMVSRFLVALDIK